MDGLLGLFNWALEPIARLLMELTPIVWPISLLASMCVCYGFAVYRLRVSFDQSYNEQARSGFVAVIAVLTAFALCGIYAAAIGRISLDVGLLPVRSLTVLLCAYLAFAYTVWHDKRTWFVVADDQVSIMRVWLSVYCIAPLVIELVFLRIVIRLPIFWPMSIVTYALTFGVGWVLTLFWRRAIQPKQAEPADDRP